MEIYVQKSSRVSFEAPASTSAVTAKASLNGGTPINLILESPVSGSKMRYTTLPYLDSEGTVVVSWKFNVKTFTGVRPVTITDTYDVVTPILTTAEIREVWEDATDAEVLDIEKDVRHIIQAHTGQRFGKFVGSHHVRGSDQLILDLPARLITLDTVDGQENVNTYFTVEADGWLLRHYPWGVPPVKADFHGLHQHVGGVIHNPNNVKLGQFYTQHTYDLNGSWGHEEVPEPVKTAAKLLVSTYGCGDSEYRDRYLQSMTAADWRIQFNNGAFLKTGHVRADQLLAPFVLARGWVVI